METRKAQIPVPIRWRTALGHAASRVLAARWRSTVQALHEARADYALLRLASVFDVRASRKAAQRVYDLEQLRAVLAHELFAQR
ncbi:MAG TPA: hypothetical protein VH109_04085 [Steroidobacteraceae bacterium]|jgi:hypothetical protein|nr:hypothetical protein [Steroidobacteraceae bacterium]